MSTSTEAGDQPRTAGRYRATGAVAGLVILAAGAAGLVSSLQRVGPTSTVGGSTRGIAAQPTHGQAGEPIAARSSFAASGAPASAEKVSSGASGAAFGERIEESGNLTVVVPAAQIQPDMGRLMALAQGFGGFVASTDTQSASPGSPAQGSVTLDVPVGSFAEAVARARSLGKVSSLSTQATDVTGQYVDLQARITADEDTRQQYLTIMSKATTTGSVLAVQAQLDNLQSQLQQLQGQLKQLTSETTYATLSVTLSEKTVAPPPKPVPGLEKAWRSAVRGFVAGFEGVVRVAGPLAFALLLAGTLYFFGRFAWRSWRLRRRPPAATQAEP